MRARGFAPGLAAAALLASGAAHGDAIEQGRELFAVCAACHPTTADAAPIIGPTLNGVVGRSIATVAGFAYTPALGAVGGTWSAEALDRFLTDPSGYAPGTAMGLVGIDDPGHRAALIAYLGTLVPGAGLEALPDPFGPDWPDGPGRAETGALCNACHSLDIVRQQRLPRLRWEKLLTWMTEEQGMPAQNPATLELMLDYLEAHFGAPATSPAAPRPAASSRSSPAST